MITLFSDEKICFWVITVNLTRHWGGDKRNGRTITSRPGTRSSMTVTGTVHDRSSPP